MNVITFSVFAFTALDLADGFALVSVLDSVLEFALAEPGMSARAARQAAEAAAMKGVEFRGVTMAEVLPPHRLV
ncbi:hypothetical protein [Streptomyces sp. NPDC059009]|uniref:hypothetical protein n=1 Tax=Streptomyces sp. NPDC059009 TaxID=3346694 RepID=UPI00368B7C26